MPEEKMKTLLQEAVEHDRAVAAFNVITLEHAEGIVTGAERAGQPVILQISENAITYHGGNVGPLAAALHEIAHAAPIRVVLHLDHIESRDLLDEMERTQIGSSMFDAGRLPYRDNVDQTAAAAAALHERGIFVEAELGYVGGKDTQVISAHQPGVRTDPGQAADYVAATGVDALAVAVGSSHAMTAQTAVLDLGLIERLAAAVPVPLVLHGSSGVPDDMLADACRAGIRKVNIGTALNIAFTGALRQSLLSSDKVDPRPHFDQARAAVAGQVQHLITVLAGI